MRPRKIACPSVSAEGDIVAEDIDPVPYDTNIVSSQGCRIHLWLGDRTADAVFLGKLVRIARWNRDVVEVTYSDGAPTDYWARQTMSWKT